MNDIPDAAELLAIARTTLLDKLLALKVAEPMASSPASFDSLKVGDAEYGKKVDLVANGVTTSLIIGAGSASSVHVRVARVRFK